MKILSRLFHYLNKNRRITKELQLLIDEARKNGLKEQDIVIAEEYLEYNELELCFDTIITQHYEYDIHISESYFLLIHKIAHILTIPEVRYTFMRELIQK